MVHESLAQSSNTNVGDKRKETAMIKRSGNPLKRVVLDLRDLTIFSCLFSAFKYGRKID
jgi:hypothetical protein